MADHGEGVITTLHSSLETCPGEQEIQDVARSSSAILFSGHFVQLDIELSRYVPALHLTEGVFTLTKLVISPLEENYESVIILFLIWSY